MIATTDEVIPCDKITLDDWDKYVYAKNDYAPSPFKPQRLLKLAEVLENFSKERKKLSVPVEYFDLDSFGYIPLAAARNKKVKELKCGSSACALGTAALHPWFISKGLRWVSAYSAIDDGLDNEVTPIDVEFQGYSNFDAAQKFFGITKNQAEYLFDPGNYPRSHKSPRYVASRIRSLVKKIEKYGIATTRKTALDDDEWL
jgi:hypothetical protein